MTTGRLSRSSNQKSVKLDFDINTANETLIKNVPKDLTIREVSVLISEAFDDSATEISVGTSAANERYLEVAENDPETLGEYSVSPNDKDSNVVSINLYISPGTSTQGKGTIFIYYI